MIMIISPSPLRRNQALDLLRGIAIMMVVLHHVEPHTIPGLPTLTGGIGYIFWRLRSFGVTGVDLFFVLSGFLVGGLLLSELQKTGNLRVVRFWLRRGLKIWPSYFALLAVLAITGTSRWLDLSSPSSTVQGVLVHGLFLQNYLDQYTNTPTWSLAVEEHFYLLLPCLLLLLNRYFSLAKVGWLVGAVMVTCLGARIGHLLLGHQDNDFMLSHNRFDSLLVGVGLAWAWRSFPDKVRQLTRNGWLVAALVTVLVAPGLFYSRKDGLFFTLGFSMLSLGYASLLMRLVAHGGGWLEASKLGRTLAIVGRWSYNIYLWHFFLPLLLGQRYAQVQLWLVGALPSPILVVAAQSLVYVLLSIGAGWLFTTLVEYPTLKWRDKMLSSQTAAVPASELPKNALTT
jgi:peptidoglycan/LPS O-acetylase OafA/YrhL